ncbi:replicative DNA helicase [Streptomyces sp. UH6]|uniref:replicative DNA helicase n=1 Tax=Streptomyces sp. UH6 TaxID=2748379 RepID=UPI0015D4C45F|nr:replicative DNA helicase [Streptomyces sp. UH6]NYV73492.1 replicative DNA helicase [Streptomyces sp. UH6]
MTTVPAQIRPPADEPYPEPGLERVPPHDAAAEAAVLGAMLLSKDAIGDAIDALAPLGAEAFYLPAHQYVYRAVVDMYAKGKSVDPITVSGHLTETGEIGKVGGPAALHALAQGVSSPTIAVDYAGIVVDRAKLRRLAATGVQITQLGYAGLGDADDVLDQAAAELARVTQGSDQGGGLAFRDVFAQAVAATEQTQQGTNLGVLTGYIDLDACTSGLHAGQMVIIAGRPAMGKSTVALDIARQAVFKDDRTVAFFSLEMGAVELGQRVMSAEARVALHHIRSGSTTDDDWARIARISERMDTDRLIIDDRPSLSLTQIKAAARRIQQRQGLDLVIIDYLQLIQSPGRRAESRQQEVSDISRGIKLMAKELDVPVIVLAQLNRGPEQRADKRPMVSDLRESGSLEQDADVVVLVHREDAYEKESPRAGEVDLILAKHRNGPTATVTVAAQLHYSRFVDMAQS